jgi:hypothetical protein
MTSIDAVAITAQYDGMPPWPACLYTDPGGIQVGRLDAGILSLDLPDGDRRRVPCSNVDEAVREAMLTWNTAEGFATLERWIDERDAQWQQYRADVAAATWTGKRRHEWQEPKQLVALVKVAIQQAVKDGILPMPNDYRVTWRSDDHAIYIRTHHALLRSLEIEDKAVTLLRPFNASIAGDFGGDVIERHNFRVEVEAPTGPKSDRSLLQAERIALYGAHCVAGMEGANFPANDIDYVRAFFGSYAPVTD